LHHAFEHRLHKLKYAATPLCWQGFQINVLALAVRTFSAKMPSMLAGWRSED
jgi:hypothetical protein